MSFPVLSGGNTNKQPGRESHLTVFAVAAAATLSIFCVRTGFLGLFFLLPLALVGFFAGVKALWFAGFLGIAGNALLAFWGTYGADPVFLQWHIVYYTVMAVVFCWINAGTGKPLFFFPVSAVYRLVAGSLAVTAAMIPLFNGILRNPEFNQFLAEQLGAVEGVDSQAVLGSLQYFGIRGGILFSILFFFAVTRQAAIFITWLVKRERPGGSLVGFHTGRFLIWVLSVSLGAVLLGKITGIELLEIGAWNILVLCGILYLAQGWGIALYFLVRMPPFLRILINLAVLLILFRPGINALIPGILIVAGIIENWVPFRVSGSPPTPEA